jgi:hypothetical protein
MKLYAIFTIMICFIIFEAKSQQIPYSKKPSQMSKYEFLSLASESDSLTAVVNMFFRKRKSSTTAGWIVAGGATVISLVVFAAWSIPASVGTVFFILPEENNTAGNIFLVGLAGGAAITTIGRSTYTKKKLYNVITEYQDTNKIPYQYASKLVPKDFYFKSR